MWGGRFATRPADLMQAINVSIGFDRRLADQDLAGSRAHAAMLRMQGVITSEDEAAIQGGLDAIAAEIRDGTFPFRDEFEDIHMNVEARLRELIGPAAGRLHTARSRNDQVAVDFRLWVRDACDRTVAQLKRLQGALLDRAEQHADTLMPGFTHLQPAQPVTFGHHLMAYVEMFGRDAGRFADWAPPPWPGRPSPSTGTPPPAPWALTGRRPTRWTACPTGTSPWSPWPPPPCAGCTCRAWPRSW